MVSREDGYCGGTVNGSRDLRCAFMWMHRDGDVMGPFVSKLSSANNGPLFPIIIVYS